MSENKNIKSYSTRTVWNEQETLGVTTSKEHTLKIDTSLKQAMNPIATWFAGLAACDASTIGIIAKIQKIQIDSLEIEIDGWRNYPPRSDAKMQEINIRYFIKSSATTKQIENLIKNAEKNCPVFQSLHPDIKLTTTINHN